MKQSTATVNAIMSVLKSKGVNYVLNGETPVSEFYDLFKTEVNAILCAGFKSGDVDMSEEAKAKYLGDDTELKKYVTGLINNWVRKHPEFNGGSHYIPKNPGSRTGSADEQIKALKQLMKQTNDAVIQAEIQQAINERLAEIKPTATVEINVNALPAHLRHLVK